ncbi:MAG TPA: CBS domain-containing protein [Thermoleophilia bacterium]|nr:CBS domain-containing protein [Thermoleophilia bacterium]
MVVSGDTMRVGDIMQTDLVACAPDEPLVGVVQQMHRRRVGACLVLEGGRLAGIFTERDLVRLVAGGADVAGLTVAAGMTGAITMATPDADLTWAAETMRRLGVRHLPVGEDGQVVGLVSLRDLFAAAEAALRLHPRGAEVARDVLIAAGGGN